MNTILRMAAVAIALVLMLMADVPLLPVQLVPEAQAILGVRRRTAVVVGATVHAADSAQMAQAQQQTAAAQQQAAAAEKEAAAPSRRLPLLSSRLLPQRLPRRRQPPGHRCRWAPWFPPSPRGASPPRSAERRTTTAAGTSTARCFRGTSWYM